MQSKITLYLTRNGTCLYQKEYHITITRKNLKCIEITPLIIILSNNTIVYYV